MVDTVTNLIRAGVLEKGDQLPGTAALAAHLGVAKVPVERAYAYLVGLKVVATRKQLGTVIASTDAIVDYAAKKVISNAILACRQLHMGKTKIATLFRHSLTEHFGTRVRKKQGAKPRRNGRGTT